MLKTGHQFTWKTAMPQDKFLELNNLLLTTILYIFNFEFHQQTNDVWREGLAISTTADIHILAHEQTAISISLNPSKVSEHFLMTLIPFL